jgi:hypothetical protein
MSPIFASYIYRRTAQCHDETAVDGASNEAALAISS